MKLTDKEKDIFHVAQLAPRSSVAELRELCGHRDHTIRYHLQRGLEEGLLIPRCFVNLHRLGYIQFEVFFTLVPEMQNGRAQLLKALAESDSVSWLGEVGGEFNYGANICARSMGEAIDWFDSLSAKYGHLVSERQIAVRTSLEYYGNKYLSDKPRPRQFLSYNTTDERAEIDELDHRILRGIMKHSPDARRTLAQSLSLPLSTLEHRIKKLEQSGVIVGYYYYIDANRLGVQSFLFLVGVKGVTQELKDRLRDFARSHRNVMVYIHTIGPWDFELAIEVEDAQQSVAFSQELHKKFGDSLRFLKVLPSFSYPKVLEYPFTEFAAVVNS